MMDALTPSDGAAALVRKLWQYCNVLRDDGLSYPDYVEQLTYLLFLKMSDEQQSGPVPPEYAWNSLAKLSTEAMHRHYGQILAALGEHGGMLGLIFRNAKNKIRDPAKLRLLVVDLIGETEWMGLSPDLKGDAYEGLLEKNARDTKSGAGQYFTPRPLIEAIVECVDPRPGELVCDPACGTAGFLLAAFRHLRDRNPGLTTAQRNHLATKAIHGVELVEEVARLAAMHLLLHGVLEGTDGQLPIVCRDSLRDPPRAKMDVVLTNPPFGVKGSITYAGNERRSRSADELTIVRSDSWVETANKQLNFLQHIQSMLKPGGRAAVILPDNVLFESGAAAVIRRRLIATHDVHTLLRLPTGLFYAQGVKANVLFFDRPARSTRSVMDRDLWVYDLRSDNRFTLKTNPLRRGDLAEFVRLYRPGEIGKRRSFQEIEGTSPRWHAFTKQQILSSGDCSLDLMRRSERTAERGAGLARLDEISQLISNDLLRALTHLAAVAPKRRSPSD
jgi:type I restriction enzyme M protein